MSGRVHRALAGLGAGLALGLVPALVQAHPLAPALLQLEERADGRVAVEWRRPVRVQPGAERVPVLPPSCARVGPIDARADALAVSERWLADCGPAGLVGQRVGVTGLALSGSDALLRVQLRDGRTFQRVLRAAEETLVVPERPARGAVAVDYGRLGLEHILSGADHLLFVFGLVLLVGGGRRLLATVTAFTAGHSVTLSLAALGLVRFPSGPIEVCIALTVLWLAIDLAQPRGARPSWLRRAPWAMAGAFGLLHGLGFAGALAEAGLPTGEIPLALLSFNVGIELGQLLFVGVVIALLAGWRRAAPADLLTPAGWPARVPLYAMGSLAAFWCLERAALLVR